MKPADIRLGQHVPAGLVLGPAIPTGYGVLGWRMPWDADGVFNGATAVTHPYINSLPYFCGSVVQVAVRCNPPRRDS